MRIGGKTDWTWTRAASFTRTKLFEILLISSATTSTPKTLTADALRKPKNKHNYKGHAFHCTAGERSPPAPIKSCFAVQSTPKLPADSNSREPIRSIYTS
mmetsp:Transcript_16531/g.26857  ORF Transcript_16531/g.26857 Transcript_16531/m.26857 type:complete len:100 (-) Transcript_16531:392-691(-)